MFALDQVVLWGRSFDEYRRMFSLAPFDLQLQIIGCGDGPAGFNAEATRRGGKVVSIDPIYRWNGAQIRERIAATYDLILRQTRLNASDFVWDTIRTVEELGHVRMAAMQEFLDDYDGGKRDGRYVEAGLPTLPFPNSSFDLAISSHFLFLYSEQFGEAFHQSAIIEMCRVAAEVRIFPLLELNGKRSRHVERCAKNLCDTGHEVTIEDVPYEFQRGGNQMMRIRVPARPRKARRRKGTPGRRQGHPRR